MTKKAIKSKELTVSRSKLTKVETRSNPQSVEAFRSTFADAVLNETSQTFSAEDQALEFLVSSITSKLGAEGGEGAQMREFLNLILETDPSLKEDILDGISKRK